MSNKAMQPEDDYVSKIQETITGTKSHKYGH